MLSEKCYIQAQLNCLQIVLALADNVPAHSGNFETAYKTKNGKELGFKQ